MSEVRESLRRSGGDRRVALASLGRLSAGVVRENDEENDDKDKEGMEEVLSEQRGEEREVLESMFGDCFSSLQEEAVWRVALQVEVPSRVAEAIACEVGGDVMDACGHCCLSTHVVMYFSMAVCTYFFVCVHTCVVGETEVSFPVVLEMHLPCFSNGDCSYPRCPPVLFLRDEAETTESGSTSGANALLEARHVRREVTASLAQLVRSEELRGGAVMFACCLWVQEGGGEGLGMVLDKLANQCQPKQQLQPQPKDQQAPDQLPALKKRPAEGAGGGREATGAAEIKGDSSKSHKKHSRGRVPLSRQECIRLSEALLLSWQQKTGAASALGKELTGGKGRSVVEEYKKMQVQRSKLPAGAFKEQLLKAISQHQVVLVSGETG